MAWGKCKPDEAHLCTTYNIPGNNRRLATKKKALFFLRQNQRRKAWNYCKIGFVSSSPFSLTFMYKENNKPCGFQFANNLANDETHFFLTSITTSSREKMSKSTECVIKSGTISQEIWFRPIYKIILVRSVKFIILLPKCTAAWKIKEDIKIVWDSFFFWCKS